jgi:glycosyltransferase involved in cell wall biosynthesis
MKILLTVDPEIPVPPVLYGGIERIADMLIHGFMGHGHEVSLCANPASEVNCRLYPWPGKASQRKADTVRNLLMLTTLCAKKRFDIVHSFSRLAYMSFIMPLRIPKIMSYQREPTLQQIKKAVRLSHKRSLIFTGCSDYISRQISPVAEAYTIYNCAPFEKYTLSEHIFPEAPLVFLGRIEEIKGTHLAIEIAHKTQRKLIIAGNIPADKEQYFDQKIKPFLNDQIQYAGPLNDDQKNRVLGNAHAMLMPIEWNEPFGIVMVEAMACGTPVIGLSRGSVPEVITNGITGYACTSVDEMIAAVNNCSGLNRRIVREHASTKFSNTVIVKEYLALYQKLITRDRK